MIFNVKNKYNGIRKFPITRGGSDIFIFMDTSVQYGAKIGGIFLNGAI